MGHTDDTMIYAVIPRPLSRSQGIESLNQDLAAVNFWCLKRHVRFNPMKTESAVAIRSQTSVPSYGELTHGGAELGAKESAYFWGYL